MGMKPCMSATSANTIEQQTFGRYYTLSIGNHTIQYHIHISSTIEIFVCGNFLLFLPSIVDKNVPVHNYFENRDLLVDEQTDETSVLLIRD